MYIIEVLPIGIQLGKFYPNLVPRDSTLRFWDLQTILK